MAESVPTAPFAQFVVDVEDIIDLGSSAIGHRRLVPITGGTVSGPIGAGIVLPGGADWQWLHADGTIALDAHYVLRLDSGELVEVQSTGLRHVPVDGPVYFRTVVRMTTTSDRPEINQRLFISVGSRLERQVVLDLYPVG